MLLGKAEEVWLHADDYVASSHLAGVGITAGVEHGQKVLEQQKVKVGQLAGHHKGIRAQSFRVDIGNTDCPG